MATYKGCFGVVLCLVVGVAVLAPRSAMAQESSPCWQTDGCGPTAGELLLMGVGIASAAGMLGYNGYHAVARKYAWVPLRVGGGVFAVGEIIAGGLLYQRDSGQPTSRYLGGTFIVVGLLSLTSAILANAPVEHVGAGTALFVGQSTRGTPLVGVVGTF